MKALELINTGQWSNIPPCVVQSINILVELTRTQGLNLEHLKSQFSDLTIKVSSKNQRFESHIEELQASFGNLKSSTSNHFKELGSAFSSSQESVDKVGRTALGQYNELKVRMTHMASEHKKQGKQFEKRIEEFSEKILQDIDLQTEKAKVDLEENLKEFVSKYVIFARDIEEVIGALKDKQLVYDENFKNLNEKVSIQTAHLDINANSLKNVNDILSRLNFRNQKHKTSILNLSEQVEKLANRSESSSSSPKSSPSPVILLDPLKDKLDKLENKFEKFELDFKLANEKFYFHSFQENKKLEESLKTWARSEIIENVEGYLGEAKKKLDWIPNGCESMKGMTVTEARIFLLESRIRLEEKSRIIAIQNLENEFKLIQRPKSVPSHKKSKTVYTPVEDKPVNSQRPKIVQKRPNSSLGYREMGSLGKTGIREMFKIKVNDMVL